MEFPAFRNGKVYVWRPAPGLDPSLLTPHLLIGATVYAIQRDSGVSEEKAQIEAEKSAFEACYGVKF